MRVSVIDEYGGGKEKEEKEEEKAAAAAHSNPPTRPIPRTRNHPPTHTHLEEALELLQVIVQPL